MAIDIVFFKTTSKYTVRRPTLTCKNLVSVDTLAAAVLTIIIGFLANRDGQNVQSRQLWKKLEQK